MTELNPDDLKDLLERCQKGEQEAISLLVRHFRPRALSWATGRLKDKDLAEDAVQEAFIAALASLSDLRQPEAFPAWLHKIVRTQANRIAGKRRESGVQDDDNVPDRKPSPRRIAELAELRQKVREALDALSPDRRKTAELFYLDDLGCADIADLMDVPLGTVKSRLFHARNNLRSILLGYVDDKVSSPGERMDKEEEEKKKIGKRLL
jgi:RNA polymerase sigma factor (sigma-70 family)